MIHGYYMTAGKTAYFYRTDAQKRTPAVIRAFIETIGTHRGAAPETIDRAKEDTPTLEDFRRRITPATIEKKELPTLTYYTISGRGFSASYPQEDFNRDVFVFA